MRGTDELRSELERIDGRGYKAYKDLAGRWDFGGWTLAVDHVQGDPFATPSRLIAHLPPERTELPAEACRAGSRAVGTAALLARRFAAEASEVEGRRGSGKSGRIDIEAPGQEVLPTTAVRVEPDGSVEARFRVGLPARGRRVLGGEAAELLLEDVPAVVGRALVAEAYDPEEIREAWAVNEDADALRATLSERDLLAFVADGAVLPRRSGVDDRPLGGTEEGRVASAADHGGSPDEGPGAPDAAARVVPFRSPDPLRVTLEAPNAGAVHGMGIPRGVTLIVGGGYHGKSTLLRAIERGVYNHRPGDGRERVVTDRAAVKVRAEDGRSVAGVDISAFIGRLPGGEDTTAFSTPNASGSTSQAAAISEALEAGASAILVDEDTAATNFMIRDRRMQALVPKEEEPITPFVDRVRELHERLGVSSVLVLGGSGDYLDVADTVVAMRDFVPRDVTEEAGRVAKELPTGRTAETGGAAPLRGARVPLAESVDPRRGRRSVSLKVRGRDEVLFGTETIELSAVEQVVSWAQLKAVAEALVLAREEMDGRRTLAEVLDRVEAHIDEEGLDALGAWRTGELAAFRRFELAAALNRLRTLEVEPPQERAEEEGRTTGAKP